MYERLHPVEAAWIRSLARANDRTDPLILDMLAAAFLIGKGQIPLEDSKRDLRKWMSMRDEVGS
jgi:hypothetical protein